MEKFTDTPRTNDGVQIALIDKENSLRLIEQLRLIELRSSALFVEYEGHADELRSAGCAVFPAESGRLEAATVISPVTERSLRTTELFSCACIVAVGSLKTNPDKNVAVLAHLYSAHLFRKSERDVRDEVSKRLKELLGVCDTESVRIIVAGGQAGQLSSDVHPSETLREQADEVLTQMIFNGVGPVQISWLKNNKTYNDSQEVLLNTETRTLYLLQS